jgi:hypothetical protein
VPPNQNQKEMLCRELKDMFTLPEGVDEELVKKCALKKMAVAFSTFKKKLFGNYFKQDMDTELGQFPLGQILLGGVQQIQVVRGSLGVI